jgi:DASS family divalent anion:Na+ symporter
LNGFSNTVIWLIVSAFLFAKGFIKTGLGNRIAYLIMRAIGNSTLKLAYALSLSDLIISPATLPTLRGAAAFCSPSRSVCAGPSIPTPKPAPAVSGLLSCSRFFTAT